MEQSIEESKKQCELLYKQNKVVMQKKHRWYQIRYKIRFFLKEDWGMSFPESRGFTEYYHYDINKMIGFRFYPQQIAYYLMVIDYGLGMGE